MIATLRGVITEKPLQPQLIIEVHGVGYGIMCTASDAERLSVGEEAALYIYEVIREDTHDLYGFMERPSRQLFEQLLSVSGVGPKAALAILSLSTTETVAAAIAGGDVVFLATASGVGKRTAERLAVELKDKVAALTATSASLDGASSAPSDAALEALEALGYSRLDAQAALAAVERTLSDEERIKQALRAL